MISFTLYTKYNLCTKMYTLSSLSPASVYIQWKQNSHWLPSRKLERKKRDKILAHRNVNIYDDPYLQTNKLQRGPEDEASSTTPASELALSVLIGVSKHSSDLKGTIAYLTSSKWGESRLRCTKTQQVSVVILKLGDFQEMKDFGSLCALWAAVFGPQWKRKPLLSNDKTFTEEDLMLWSQMKLRYCQHDRVTSPLEKYTRSLKSSDNFIANDRIIKCFGVFLVFLRLLRLCRRQTFKINYQQYKCDSV